MSPVTSRPGPRHPVKRSATHTCKLPVSKYSLPSPAWREVTSPPRGHGVWPYDLFRPLGSGGK